METHFVMLVPVAYEHAGPSASNNSTILNGVLTFSTSSFVVTILCEGTTLKWTLVFSSEILYLTDCCVWIMLSRLSIEPTYDVCSSSPKQK